MLSPRFREIRLTKNVNHLRLLQIAPRLPWPLDTGAKLRNYHLARSLAAQIDITLIAFGEDISEGELSKVYERIVTVPRDEKYSFGNLLRGAVSGTPLPLLNYTTRKMSDALERLLVAAQFDLIQVESIHLMNYLPLLRAAANHPLIVCDWHNFESDLMKQYAEHERNFARRTYARRTARLMVEAEKRARQEFDAHIVVSKLDAKRMEALSPDSKILVIDNGVDAAHYAGEPATVANRIVFVGSMDYHANMEGAMNFARNVWPMIHEKQSDLRFTIVGRNPPADVKALSSLAGIEVTGSVADVRPYYREALAAVVPLNVGGGSRLKILEAMAAGVPVISTKLGAEGLQVTDGEDILIADSPFELTNGIFKVIDGTDLRAQLIDGGHALVRERYDWSTLGAKLLAEYQALVAQRNSTDGAKSR